MGIIHINLNLIWISLDIWMAPKSLKSKPSLLVFWIKKSHQMRTLYKSNWQIVLYIMANITWTVVPSCSASKWLQGNRGWSAYSLIILLDKYCSILLAIVIILLHSMWMPNCMNANKTWPIQYEAHPLWMKKEKGLLISTLSSGLASSTCPIVIQLTSS